MENTFVWNMLQNCAPLLPPPQSVLSKRNIPIKGQCRVPDASCQKTTVCVPVLSLEHRQDGQLPVSCSPSDFFHSKTVLESFPEDIWNSIICSWKNDVKFNWKWEKYFIWNPWLWNSGEMLPESKAGVSEVLQKGLVSSRNLILKTVKVKQPTLTSQVRAMWFQVLNQKGLGLNTTILNFI